MIEILPYRDRDHKKIRAMDPLMAAEIRCHQDVLPETVLTAKEDGRFLGAGYLIAGPSYRLILQGRPKDNRFGTFSLHLVFKTILTDERGVDAAIALLEALKGLLKGLQAQHPDGPLEEILWVKEQDTAYREMLIDSGFSPGGKMFVMKRPLFSLSDLPEGKYRVSCPDLLKKDRMAAYMKVNSAAFGIPDSSSEMRFLLKHRRAKVFAVTGEDQSVRSAVTVYPLSEREAATENVFSDPDFRRQGMTTAVLVKALRVLRKAGFRRAVLTVDEDDLPAIALYEKLGYRRDHTLYAMRYDGKRTAGEKAGSDSTV